MNMSRFRIKELIEGKGYTINSFAEHIGMPQSNLSNIANGKANPTDKTLQMVADNLGVEVPDLYNRKGSIFICENCGAVYEMKKK